MNLYFHILSLAFCMMVSCSSADNKMMFEKSTDVTAPQAEASQADEASTVSTAQTQNLPSTPVSLPIDKKIIKTANITLEVKNKKAYGSFLQNLLKKTGAYISKEDNNVYDEKDETNLVIKVPVLQFEPLLEEMVSADVKQLQKSINSEDITSTYIDTKARLDTRKATRDKYLELMRQASKMEDIIRLQQEINNIQEDIESAEARLNQLSGDAQYSTINLTYFEAGKGYSYQNSKPGFIKRIADAFSNGGNIFTSLIIGIISLWPVWLSLGLIVFLFKRWRRKSNFFTKKN